MTDTKLSDEAPSEPDADRAMETEGRSSAFANHKKLGSGQSHTFNSVTITYTRGDAASDPMIAALNRGGQSRTKPATGWSQLDGSGKADFIATALSTAAGVVTTAASLWGSPSPKGKFSMLISLENKSDHILVPSMIAPMEWAPGRSWARVKEAPSLMLPGDDATYEMVATSQDFWHEPKVSFQVVPADKNLNPITLHLFFRQKLEPTRQRWRFQLSGVGHATAASRDHAQLLTSDPSAVDDYSPYSLHCWDIQDSAKFPSLLVASREVDGVNKEGRTAVLSVAIL